MENITIVYFKHLGSRVFRDSFNQYVFLYSKQCTNHKTNAIYTWENFIRFFEWRNVNGNLYGEKSVAQPSVVMT